MLPRTPLQIFCYVTTIAGRFYKDFSKGIIETLSVNLDSYNLSKDQLLGLYDVFDSNYIALSYMMIHEFKNHELKNVLIMHRGANYIKKLIKSPRLLKDIEKYGLSDQFFSDYFNRSFAQTKEINEEFIINYLLNFPDEMKEPDLMAQLFSLTIQEAKFLHISEPTLLNVAKILFNHPQRAKLLAKHLSKLDSIEFTNGGRSNDNYKEWTNQLMSRLPKSNKPNHALVNELEECFNKENQAPLEDLALSDEWTFLRIQGRTILLQNHEKKILAIKIKKENEPIVELNKEFHTTSYLKQHAEELKLKSYFPTPIAITKINNVIDLLNITGMSENISANTLISMIGKSTDQIAYVYQVDADQIDYFTYLQDIKLSDETFRKANRNIISDLFQLLANGMVYHQLADLFHNGEEGHLGRNDRGRYLVLVNLLRRIGGNGTGRLNAWKKAVEFPNLRGSNGLADDGDWISLSEFAYGKFAEDYFSDAKKCIKIK